VHRSWSLIALLAALTAVAPPVSADAPAKPSDGSSAVRPRQQQHVLVLYSPPRHAAVTAWEDAFYGALTQGSPAPLHLHTEYSLEASLAGGEEAQVELRHLFQRKYGRVRLDLVVPVGRAAFVFALRHGTELFGQVPILFAGVVREGARDLALDPHVTGVWLDVDWAGTLDAALRLQPDTRHVALVSGTSDTDRAWTAGVRDQLAARVRSVHVTHLTGLELGEAADHVATLGPGSVVLLGPFLQDASGRSFIGAEARVPLTAVANVPVYSPLPTPGAVGGRVVRFEAHGVAAGRLARAVLRGERPPAVDGPAAEAVFDARALARWDLDERVLPSGSVVDHRDASVWGRYRWHIVAAVAFVAAQSALIGGLLLQRTRRRRVQQALAERLRFERLLSDLSTSFITVAPGALDDTITQGLRHIGEEMDLDRVSLLGTAAGGSVVRITHVWSRPGIEPMKGIERDTFPWITTRLVQGRAVDVADPADLPAEAAADRAALVARGVRSLAVVPLVIEGTVVGALVCNTRGSRREWSNVMNRLVLLGQVFANARARQRSETALRDSHGRIRDLAGQLLRATEEERRRIARDIHDDLSQKIAALGLGIGVLERHLREVDPSVRRRIAQLHERIAALGDHTRRLCHDLHPAALQYAGLGAGLREHCAEFQADTGIEVDLDVGPSLDGLPPETALCLYRVAQEALANVARHSGAARVEVVAAIEGKETILVVRDSGAGFKPVAGRGDKGLGLLSMSERVRLIGGRVEIHSAPGQGTEVRVIVPTLVEAAGERAG
jgi:signal transduction histidine kinase